MLRVLAPCLLYSMPTSSLMPGPSSLCTKMTAAAACWKLYFSC